MKVTRDRLKAFRAEYPDLYSFETVTCECVNRRVMLKAAEKLNIPDDCRDASLDWFDELPAYQQEHKVWARWATERMAEGEQILINGIYRPGMVLSGPTGTGKSSFAAVVAKARIMANVAVGWRDYTMMYEDIKRTYSSDDANALESAIRLLGTIPLLIIDEMGHMGYSEQLPIDKFEKTHMVISKRYEKKLPTIITTNLTQGEFVRRFGSMIADRVGTICHWIDCRGVNFRSPNQD